jgi:hemoglobin/transferrin/lactoferrin receptor protein
VGVQPYTGYSDTTGLATLDYRFGKGALSGWRNKATYLVSRIEGAGRTDKLYDSQKLQLYDNELHLVYDRMHLSIDALSTTIDLTPSFQHFFERKDNISMADDLTTPLSSVRDEVMVNTFGFDGALETTFVDDRLALRYGGTFYRDWIEARRMDRSAGGDWLGRPDQAYPSGSSYDQYGAFALLEGAPLASSDGHRLNLRGGYRIHGMAGAADAQAGLPEAEFSYLGHVFMGAVQYLYRDTATVAFAFAQGFRAPNLQEAVQLGDTGKFFHVPNDDLKPERSDTFELLGRAKLWRLTVSWMAYVSMLDDLILRVPTSYQGDGEIDGKPVMHNVNAEGGLLWGTEGGLGADLGLGFSIHGQLSTVWGEEYLPDGGTEPLNRVPPLFGTTKLRYDTELPQRWRGFLETYARWAMEQDRLSPEDESDARIPEGGTPGWWTWNLRAGLSDGVHHRVALAVENLLDRRYKYHGSGVYAPGTNALVSYEVCF